MKRSCSAALTLLLAGCVSPQNDRLTIGQSTRLEVFAPPKPPTPETPTDQIQAPSVTGIDRSHWEQTDILVPVDGTVHYPTYGHRVIVTDKTARQRRQFPTVDNALELYGGSESQQELEALLNPLTAASDIIAMPFRMVFSQRPWARRISPDVAYDRWPAQRRTASEPVGPPTEPFGPPPPQKVTP